MGYYSDVAIRLWKNDARDFINEYKDWVTPETIYDLKDGSIVIEFNFIKWYGPKVDEINDWLQQRDFATIIIGESIGDIELDETCEELRDGFWPVTTIDIDVPGYMIIDVKDL